MAKAVNFDGLISRLEGIIAELGAAGLAESVALLNIGRLDLILRANEFSEEDLEKLLSSLRNDERSQTHHSIETGHC